MKYAPECCYRVVEEISEDITGGKQISDQGIQELVIKEALKMKKLTYRNAQKTKTYWSLKNLHEELIQECLKYKENDIV